MKWKKQDIQQYVKSKEYIDTAIIPLVPFSLDRSDEELASLTYQNEVMELFSDRLEKEYKGRVFRLPSYTYIKSSTLEQETERLNLFYEEISKQPFKYVFWLTFDSRWKKYEKGLEGHLLWVPVMKEGDLNNEETQKLLLDQLEQVTDLIKSYWSE
ncbi:YpiF family protein [Salinibacillus aidingensis]|uniref:YpiF family protein n=1 Tax=Salinibacillus aidingensis TaxID=237684 RepID=A0ABP3KLZ6_9BACI